MAQQEGPAPEVETKPTKAIVSFVGTLATALIATASSTAADATVFLGWTGEELALSGLGAVVAALAVYGFRNAPKE